MINGSAAMQEHGTLMDSVYRGQRHIYDATRKYFLFGRDAMIRSLDCKPGQSVLEIGCGTGRNLALVARRWPGSELHGLDISGEMLKSARAKLGEKTVLRLGDATTFEPISLFDKEGFDRVILSFALSMIPDWQGAIRRAVSALAPDGALHIVDFGDLSGLFTPVRSMLNAWLHHFHVSPRLDLPRFCEAVAGTVGWQCDAVQGPLNYYSQITITRHHGGSLPPR
jgi:S-adenosylmethionine-diacylgycerolhomoserine-N-methlytransferase